MKFAKWVGIGVLATMSACTPVKRPPDCDAHMASTAGGVLDVSRIDFSRLSYTRRFSAPAPTLQIFWQPPGDGFTVHLYVSYPKATLESLGFAEGGRIQFVPGKRAQPEQFQALLRVDGEVIARFSASPDWTPEQGDFVFSTDDVITDAINNGKTLQVTILKSGTVMNTERFKTSGTAARDQLLAKARQLIHADDPSVCMRN